MKKILLTTLTALSVAIAFGQNNSYINSGSIGKAPQEKPAQKEDDFLYGPVKYRELSETVGEKYVILPLRKDLSSKGYPFISKGEVFSDNAKLSQEDGAGKVITLKSLTVNKEYAIFTENDSKYFTAHLVNGVILNVVLKDDIDAARRLFLNKTLWMNQDFLSISDQNGGDALVIKDVRFNPVKIIDVVVGVIPACPIRFVLLTDKNETAFADVVVSGTNMTLQYSLKYLFNNVFFTMNPKLTYKFTPAMWAKIKAGVTEIGMTDEQVKLSRGFPDKINRSTGAGTADQWIYGESYLYFRNGKLTNIQN